MNTPNTTIKLTPAQRLALEILDMQAMTTLDLMDAASMTVKDMVDLKKHDLIEDTGRCSEYRPVESDEIDDIMWIPNFKKVKALGL